MKRVLLLLAFVTPYSVFAQQPAPLPPVAVTPPGTTAARTFKQLESENEWLKAQLDAALKTHAADAAACWTDDTALIQRRYEATVAQKKATAALAKMQAQPDPKPTAPAQ